jgi:hypothetical protein
LQERLGSSLFVLKALPLRAANRALDAVPVTVPEEIVEIVPEIECVEAKGSALHERAGAPGVWMSRPELDVRQALVPCYDRKRADKVSTILRAVDKRLAVIGEGQGDQPSSGEPTVDAAARDSIC